MDFGRIKYFVAILFLCVFSQVKASGCEGDIVFINGEMWALLAKPIALDSVLYYHFLEFLSEKRSKSTANWDGYTAFWEIRNNRLYLKWIEIEVYDKEKKERRTLKYDVEALKEPFASYYKKGKIQACWVDGELRAGQGSFVRYVHSGFDRNMERGQVVRLKKGKVKEINLYHNYKKPGLSIVMKEAWREISRKFPWERFPEYKNQRIWF